MKKTIVFLIALLLLFTACEKDSEGGTDLRIDSDRSFAQARTYVCETDDTVYFVAVDYFENKLFPYYSMLYYMDKATGISGSLCGKPECGHDNESCNAYLTNGSVLGLADYNGRLYWIANIYEKYYIYSAAYDGTDRQTVRELGDNDSEVRFNSTAIMTAFHRGYVYFISNYATIVNGEERNINYIYAYSLDPRGEDFVILDDENTDWIDARMQLYGNSMYIFLIDDSKDDYDPRLLRWDLDTHKLETVFDNKVPFRPAGEFWVTEEGVFMSGTTFDDPITDDEGNSVWKRNVYFYDFSTEEFESVFPITGAGGFSGGFSDGLFTVITNRKLWNNPENALDITVYDFNGQTVFADTLDESILSSSIMMWAFFAGADESNLYLYSRSHGDLVCIPFDGSEPTVLHGNATYD